MYATKQGNEIKSDNGHLKKKRNVRVIFSRTSAFSQRAPTFSQIISLRKKKSMSLGVS